jgi:3-deoxy-D-manno-octulosonate 8-phosphate phosphatase (KDO 8-P phosphatase)
MNISNELLALFYKIQFLAFDFDGVFTDNRVYTSETGEESVACWRSDGIGLAGIKKLDIPIWVISSETNPVVAKRCEKLGVNCLQGCDIKITALVKLLVKYKCDIKNAAFTGNDINDADCLENVGLPIVVADAHPDIKHLAVYKTKKPGGKGAVREICDIIIKSHNSGPGF